VHDANDKDALGLYTVDNAIIAENVVPEGQVTFYRFRDDCKTLREIGEGANSGGYAPRPLRSRSGFVATNVSGERENVLLGAGQMST
jgi:hypothetical protein